MYNRIFYILLVFNSILLTMFFLVLHTNVIDRDVATVVWGSLYITYFVLLSDFFSTILTYRIICFYSQLHPFVCKIRSQLGAYSP